MHRENRIRVHSTVMHSCPDPMTTYEATALFNCNHLVVTSYIIVSIDGVCTVAFVRLKKLKLIGYHTSDICPREHIASLQGWM